MDLKTYSYLTLEETKDWLKIAQSNTNFDDQIKRHINTACSRVESYIDGPVLSRDYTQYLDGNNSNVLVPSYYPITQITEIIVDYNRDFSNTVPVDETNYVLRGFPPLDQPILDNAEIAVKGTDIVLRDDGNVVLLGKIFAGSAIQSIRVKYKAGRGDTPDDIPEDLRTATLMLVEFLYILKENRELGIASKGVMGQNYSKRQVGESGMPMEIEAMLDEYVDYSLPAVSMPQRNNFGL